MVEEINRLYHKRKLMGVVRQANYDANEAAFYTFRNGDEIDIFELFREQATHAEYNLTKFKADKHCTEAKGFGRNRFENRKEALNASIRSLKTDLAADKYESTLYFTVHFHSTENFKAHACENKYFHLSPRVDNVLSTIQ